MTVSVGLISYNAEKTIHECLTSLCNQTYKDIHIIVSDDCSTDGTSEIIENFIKKHLPSHVRLTLLSNKKNLGIIENFRNVLDHANCKYFMWACADDQWHEKYIETCTTNIELKSHEYCTTEAVVKTQHTLLPYHYTKLSHYLNTHDLALSFEQKLINYIQIPLHSYKDNFQFSVWKTVSLKEKIAELEEVVKTRVIPAGTIAAFIYALSSGQILQKSYFFKGYDRLPPHIWWVRRLYWLKNDFLRIHKKTQTVKNKNEYFNVINSRELFYKILKHIENREGEKYNTQKIMQLLEKYHNLN